MVEIVKEHLLTPYGLRSLSPKDRDYIGCYRGNVYERDKAYHQGTVWAWLIGPYISAYVRAYAGHKDTLKYIKGLFCRFMNTCLMPDWELYLKYLMETHPICRAGVFHRLGCGRDTASVF